MKYQLALEGGIRFDFLVVGFINWSVLFSIAFISIELCLAPISPAGPWREKQRRIFFSACDLMDKNEKW
jgi:hypothetical protein